MTRIDIPGGVYAEAQPNGDWAATVLGSHISSSRYGRISLPPGGDLLYLRLSPDGAKLAGHAQDDHVWEWQGGRWVDHGLRRTGVNTVAYRENGQLVIAGPETGSQGIRQIVNGHAMTADETHADGTGLFDYTPFGDIMVGQASNDDGNGEVIGRVNDGPLLVIEGGDNYFVRFNRFGNRLAIASSQLGARNAICLWLDRSELAGLPIWVNQSLPKPDPKEPPPMSYQRRSPDLSHLVADVANDYPDAWKEARETQTHARTHRFIRIVAWLLHMADPNVGLNGKRGNPDDLSTDALAYLNPTAPGGAEVIDVINGADHSAAWNDVTRPDVLGRYVEPSQLDEVRQREDEGLDDDEPDEPEEPGGLEALVAAIVQIQEAQAAMAANLEELRKLTVADADGLADALDQTRAEVHAVADQLSRGFEASNRFLGRIELKPKT